MGALCALQFKNRIQYNGIAHSLFLPLSSPPQSTSLPLTHMDKLHTIHEIIDRTRSY